jgi:hypothetical protein
MPSKDRIGFCKHLRKQREAARLTLDDIARVTRIPGRSLEHLENGRFEDLPADVFVRGFLRSYANCVGLDPEETLRRYAECGLTPAPVASAEAQRLGGAPSSPPALARGTLTRPVGIAHPAAGPAAAEGAVGSSKRRKGKKRRKPQPREGERQAAAAPPPPTPAAEASAEPSAPAPRPAAPPPPVLVIDDADPDAAERSRRPRTDESRLTFLPASLLDADDGSRRGALTLAVIILVIVATITMSYLLRRPSSPADGVTRLGPRPAWVGEDGSGLRA